MGGVDQKQLKSVCRVNNARGREGSLYFIRVSFESPISCALTAVGEGCVA